MSTSWRDRRERFLAALARRPVPTQRAGGTTEWTWTGPTDEGPPIILYGRYRWQAEQWLMEMVERFDILLKEQYREMEGAKDSSLFDRLPYFQNAGLLLNDELAIWRAALQIRSQILSHDVHNTPMEELAHHAQAVKDVCDHVEARIRQYRSRESSAEST